MTDHPAFPHPAYRDTVLAPLFDGIRTHFAGHVDAINRAHLVMLLETGIISKDQGRTIAAALQDIEQDMDTDTLSYTGEHEDYFFLVEAELERRIGESGGMLHVARSRNDMDHTMFRMALREKAGHLMEQVLHLVDTLIVKARCERDTLVVAYTHGQPAQPTTFGHYLAAVVECLLRDAERLDLAFDSLDLCPMGAAAITTSGFPVDRHRVSELLGFEEPQLNSYGCIASVDYVTGLYSAIKLVFLHLGRVAQDMAQWSAFEVGQLHVPDSLVQVSSIMPQKRNPVPIEHLRHLSSVTAGLCDAIINTMHNTPFADMNDSEADVQQAGFAVFERGARALSLFSAFLPSCSINPSRVEANCDAACVTVTELADTLVRDEGLSFRRAHGIASTTSRAVVSRGVGLARGFDVFADAFKSETGRATVLTPGMYATAVAPKTFVLRRDRPGGPAAGALERAIKVYEGKARECRNGLEARTARRARAADMLESAFKAVLEE